MQQKLILAVVLVVTLILSVVIGSAVGEGDYVELSIYGVIGLALCYFTFAYKWTWQLILFISYLGFNYIHGFSIEASHLAIVLLLVYSLVSLFRGRVARPPVTFRMSGSRFLVALCGLWVLYGIVHFCANMAFPHIPNEYSMKNALKAYFMAYMPPALMLWVLVGPIGFDLGKNWGRSLVLLMLAALALNILAMVYLFFQGYGVSDPSMVQGGEGREIGFHIPVINAIPNIFTLRILGASSVFLAFAFLSFKHWRDTQSMAMIIILWGMCALGVVGCLVSGGRAAVLIAGFYVFVVCLVRRRTGIIALGTAAAMMCVGLANLFSDWVNHDAPLFVSRPLQYVMLEKGSAMKSIDNSSEYRTALYEEAIAEWSSDPRLLLMGRSVYRYMDDLMELKIMYGDKEAFLITNLRAGSCHALLPSVLVQYGILGAILYYAIYLAMIMFFWRLYQRSEGMEPTIRVVAFVTAVSLTVSIIVDTIGGGWFSIVPVVILALLRTAIAQQEQEGQRLVSEQENIFEVGENRVSFQTTNPNHTP